MKNDQKIKIAKNGPYIVSGNIPLDEEKIACDEANIPLNWEKTKDYPNKQQYSLCRCGKSKNKPFCDGNHITSKFNGEETADKIPFDQKAEKTTGPELILSDVREYCVGAQFCHRAGTVWNLVEQSANKVADDTAIEECANCPSGRLVLHSTKTGAEIEPTFDPSISLVEDQENKISGPIWVKGGIPLESADNEKYETRNRVTLCRCGKSKNKPFCDGTHFGIGFDSQK